jgi:hypothetical protein
LLERHWPLAITTFTEIRLQHDHVVPRSQTWKVLCHGGIQLMRFGCRRDIALSHFVENGPNDIFFGLLLVGD